MVSTHLCNDLDIPPYIELTIWWEFQSIQPCCYVVGIVGVFHSYSEPYMDWKGQLCIHCSSDSGITLYCTQTTPSFSVLDTNSGPGISHTQLQISSSWTPPAAIHVVYVISSPSHPPSHPTTTTGVLKVLMLVVKCSTKLCGVSPSFLDSWGRNNPDVLLALNGHWVYNQFSQDA